MLVLGIFKKEQLKLRHLEGGFFRKRQFVALDLYHSLDDLPREERDKIQERILGRFPVWNGTFKYTHSKRFEEFDRLALSLIEANFRDGQSIAVHDIGVSDGRTACDFYDGLSQFRGLGLSFLASDYAPFVYVLRRRRSQRRLIVDHDNNVLQIISPPFVFNIARSESLKFYSVNQMMRHLSKFTKPYTRRLLNDHRAGSSEIEHTRLELLCTECRSYISERDNFRFERYDILSGPKGTFDVIRVMNVLNRCYFPEARLQQAIENVFESLNDGGLFITGSNIEQGTTVNGGIYRKNGERMERLATSGAGSQVNALMLSAASSLQAAYTQA